MSLKRKWMMAFNYDKKETPRIFPTKGDYLLWSKDKVTAVTSEILMHLCDYYETGNIITTIKNEIFSVKTRISRQLNQ